MIKILIVVIIGISIIGIYAIGLDDFLKLIQLLIQKGIDIISNWFVDAKNDLLTTKLEVTN